MKNISALVYLVLGLFLVGCSQESQLSGTWKNVKPDTSSGINYIVYLVNDPAGYISMEFLPGSKINVVRKGGETFVLGYSIVSQGRMQITDKIINYSINGNTLTFTDANGASTTFTR
jgi:hypothetical protein